MFLSLITECSWEQNPRLDADLRTMQTLQLHELFCACIKLLSLFQNEKRAAGEIIYDIPSEDDPKAMETRPHLGTSNTENSRETSPSYRTESMKSISWIR